MQLLIDLKLARILFQDDQSCHLKDKEGYEEQTPDEENEDFVISRDSNSNCSFDDDMNLKTERDEEDCETLLDKGPKLEESRLN